MEIHQPSQDLYDFISKWIAQDFFFSRNDRWDRFGMLGVFGDYILSSTPGDILEIGVGESSVYLTALSKKYNRRIYHCDISPSKIINPMTVDGYLSSDCVYVTETAGSWAYARCILFAGSSDEMFKKLDISPIALGFIDGDHIYEQVKKDFYNVLNYIVDDGWIILHDGSPPSEEYLDENHCGGVWKLRKEIEENKDLDCITLTRGCAMSVGLTLVRKRKKARVYFQA